MDWAGNDLSRRSDDLGSGTSGRAALAALAIAVIIISKIINTAVKDKAPKQAAVAAAPAPALDEESYAVLLAAISEEARLSGEEFRVTSIKEM